MRQTFFHTNHYGRVKSRTFNWKITKKTKKVVSEIIECLTKSARLCTATDFFQNLQTLQENEFCILDFGTSDHSVKVVIKNLGGANYSIFIYNTGEGRGKTTIQEISKVPSFLLDKVFFEGLISIEKGSETISDFYNHMRTLGSIEDLPGSLMIHPPQRHGSCSFQSLLTCIRHQLFLEFGEANQKEAYEEWKMLMLYCNQAGLEKSYFWGVDPKLISIMERKVAIQKRWPEFYEKNHAEIAKRLTGSLKTLGINLSKKFQRRFKGMSPIEKLETLYKKLVVSIQKSHLSAKTIDQRIALISDPILKSAYLKAKKNRERLETPTV